MRTLSQMVAEENAARAKFEAETVAFQVNGRSVTMAVARAVFEKYHPGDDWKRPVDARGVPYDDLFELMEAVRFYQGCNCRAKPESRKGAVGDPGYRVTSEGYRC